MPVVSFNKFSTTISYFVITRFPAKREQTRHEIISQKKKQTNKQTNCKINKITICFQGSVEFTWLNSSIQSVLHPLGVLGNLLSSSVVDNIRGKFLKLDKFQSYVFSSGFSSLTVNELAFQLYIIIWQTETLNPWICNNLWKQKNILNSSITVSHTSLQCFAALETMLRISFNFVKVQSQATRSAVSTDTNGRGWVA